MKKVLFLLCALTPVAAHGQDATRSPESERIEGQVLIDRSLGHIQRRAESPERKAVQQQIENEFKQVLDEFYKRHPEPIPEPEPEVNRPDSQPTPSASKLAADRATSAASVLSVTVRRTPPVAATERVENPDATTVEQDPIPTPLERLERLELLLIDAVERIRDLESQLQNQKVLAPPGLTRNGTNTSSRNN